MQNYLESFAEKTFEKYKKLEIPNKFTLEEVGKILREKYSAIEEDINLADLESYQVHARKYYVITDIKVLDRLFTAVEKIELYNMVQISKNESEKFEHNIEKVWNDIEEGRRLNIILESEDDKYISGFTLQGQSEKLLNELMVFVGIHSFNCHLGNEEFHEYLKRLLKADYIKLEI